MPRSEGLEIDLGEEAVSDMLTLLGISRKKSVAEAQEVPPSPQEEDDLKESVVSKRVQGTIQLRGFDDDVVDSISNSIRFRVQAANLGNRIRLIIDIQK